MTQQRKCDKCDEYFEKGHNYCRICGCYLRKGQIKHVRIALAYYAHEKYCGYCGGPKNKCKCVIKK